MECWKRERLHITPSLHDSITPFPFRFRSQTQNRKASPMKTILRFQSQLLNRRSYKPGRRVRVAFRPSPRQVLAVQPAFPCLFHPQPPSDS